MFSNSLPKTIARMVAVLVLLGFGAWYFWQYQEARKQLELLSSPAVPEEDVGDERQALLNKVSELMVLPQDENPLILDVENAAELAAAQPFFQNAENGDKVLIYARAGKSILYSPSKNIIVNVGTLTVQTTPDGDATGASSIAP